MWSSINGEIVFNFIKHCQPVYSLASNPTGTVLATGSLGGYVSLWSLVDGSLIADMRETGDTFDVSWSSDGKMLCSCFSSGNLSVLHVK